METLKIKTINNEICIKFKDEPLEIFKGSFYFEFSDIESEIFINQNLPDFDIYLFESIFSFSSEYFYNDFRYSKNLLNVMKENKEFFIEFIQNEKFPKSKKININGVVYKILELNESEKLKYMTNDDAGRIIPALSTIYYLGELSDDLKKQVFLHEFFHALFFTIGDFKNYNSEKSVQINSIILYFLLMNNKKLFLDILNNSFSIGNYIQN